MQGTIEKTAEKGASNSYTISGRITKLDETTLEITELPVRKWTQDYKEFLESMLTGGEKNEQPFIKVSTCADPGWPSLVVVKTFKLDGRPCECSLEFWRSS